MDLSAMSGSIKTDFSIERLLSNEPVGGTYIRQRQPLQSGATPSWVTCTRYQPPRLQRSSNANSNRSRRAGRHARVPFTGTQAAALEAAFARAHYLAPPALKALAGALNLRDDRIKIWFQNRRARERREQSTPLIPPNSVTIPPTMIHRAFQTDSREDQRAHINNEEPLYEGNHSSNTYKSLRNNRKINYKRETIATRTHYDLIKTFHNYKGEHDPGRSGFGNNREDVLNMERSDNDGDDSPLDVVHVDTDDD